MDDTISRQLVTNLVHLTISEFMDYCADSEEVPMTEKDELLLEINKKIGTRIKELPSEQPELAQHLPNTCTDAISRQAAIDALCKACSIESDYHKCEGYNPNSQWCDWVTALRCVPSAQSEIIRREEI